MLLASSAFAWLLIGVVVIDFETMLIPDRFSIGGACAGFVLSFCFPSIHGVHFHPYGLESLQSGVQQSAWDIDWFGMSLLDWCPCGPGIWT